MRLSLIAENSGGGDYTGFDKDAKFFWFYNSRTGLYLIGGPGGYSDRIVFVEGDGRTTPRAAYVRLSKQIPRVLVGGEGSFARLYEKKRGSSEYEFNRQWGPVCPGCKRETRSARVLKHRVEWVPAKHPLSSKQNIRVCQSCIEDFKVGFADKYNFLTEKPSTWSFANGDPLVRVIKQVGGVFDGMAFQVPQLTRDQIKDYLYPVGRELQRAIASKRINIESVDLDKGDSEDQVDAVNPGSTETTTISVVNAQVLPNGLPDLNTIKSDKLRELLDQLPIATANNSAYYLSTEGMSLPDSPRLLSGGNVTQTVRGTDPANADLTLRGLTDLEVRQILTAIQILKELRIDFDIATDANKQVVGFEFKEEPLKGLGKIQVKNLLDVLKKALPEVVPLLYKKNWRGRYGQAFANICMNSNVETAPFPDFSAGAQAVISPNRKNTILVLQPTTGAGYVMYRQIEFPSASSKILLPWYEAFPYFMNNINRLAPRWQEEKDSRPLLAFRSYLFGNYGHKRADGTTIGRQGLVLSRHAENSIDILNAYIESGTEWKRYLKSPDRLPSELYEHRI